MEKAAGSVHICQDGWNVGAVHQTEAALPLAEIAEPESSSPGAPAACGPFTARPCQGQGC